MSLSSARCGSRPSATARPPQNGSTSRRSAWARHTVLRRGTCQRLPPAHFNGGFSAGLSTARVYDASPLSAAVRKVLHRLDADVRKADVAGDLFRLLRFRPVQFLDAELTARSDHPLDDEGAVIAIGSEPLDFHAMPHVLP